FATALLDRSAPGSASLDPIGQFTPGEPDRAWGMFWVIDTVPGTDRTMVWHNGQTGGYSAFLALYPQARRAVVVLANVARASEQQRIALGLTRWLITTSHKPAAESS
ncbi:MAG: beta-lactamase family protein, partial [Actinomycetota bacterium]|nr:beta-lactamase family protein [Actinomycetota bacterium]